MHYLVCTTIYRVDHARDEATCAQELGTLSRDRVFNVLCHWSVYSPVLLESEYYPPSRFYRAL